MLALLDKKLKKCINYLLTIKIKFNVLILNFEYGILFSSFESSFHLLLNVYYKSIYYLLRNIDNEEKTCSHLVDVLILYLSTYNYSVSKSKLVTNKLTNTLLLVIYQC